MGARAKNRAARMALIASLAAEAEGLQAQIDEVAKLKAEFDELAQLKAELEHARADHDELAQLKAELHHARADLDHARSTEIPALQEHVAKLEAELNSSRTTPKHKDRKRMKTSEATFDCGPQAYERAIKVLANNPHHDQHFHIHPLDEEDRVVASFSMSYVGALEVTREESQDG